MNLMLHTTGGGEGRAGGKGKGQRTAYNREGEAASHRGKKVRGSGNWPHKVSQSPSNFVMPDHCLTHLTYRGTAFLVMSVKGLPAPGATTHL